MGAFDGLIPHSGVRYTTVEYESRYKEVKPKVGFVYWTFYRDSYREVEILSMHRQFGVFRFLEPIPKKYDIGFYYEDSFFIRNTSFYLKKEE